MVNYDRKFFFLLEPHTASRATVTALKKYVSGTTEVARHHSDMEEILDWRRQHVDPKQVAGFKVVATVRNPFDALVTRWRKGSCKNMQMSEFMDKRWDTTDLTPGRGLWKEASSWVYYEDLEADLQWMFTDANISLGYDDSHRTPGKKHWSEYFSESEFNRVLTRLDWVNYLEQFGYTVNHSGDTLIDMKVRVKNTPQL